MPTVLNAANEVAVKAFLDGKIKLSDIARVNEQVMTGHDPRPVSDLETVLEADKSARAMAEAIISASAATVGVSR
jgi:1-deoxy-D-xylulose-5-phosphate reductoisomerase